MYDKETAATPNFIPASSTSTTTTTLPPLHETLNGNVTHLQEPVPCALSSASPASLPPIHPAKNNADSRMSIGRLVNQPSPLPQETEEEKARAVAEILQQLSSNEVTSLPAPVEPPTNNTATGPSLMDRFRSFQEYASTVYQGARRLALPGSQSEGHTKMEDDSEGHSTAIDKDDATLLDLESRKRRPRNELSRSSSPSHRQTARPHRTSQSNGSGPNTSFAPYSQPSAVQRSRWHQVLLGGGTQIGGVSAAVSEETMKSLKYCIQWLTYATQHLERQIAILRQFIVSMTTSTSNALIPASASASASSTLAAIRREVVETLRKVIDIVSKYAASCLPEQAKQNVRSFILGLPNRWATINRRDSATPSPVASPELGPTNCQPATQAEEYAQRLLSLATESKDMLNNVNGIFSNTVCSAEAWVHRLKAVGVPARGAAAMGPIEFDSIPQLSQHQNGVIPNGYSSGPRTRRSSSSMRANHHRPLRPAPLDDNYSESSSDSEAEPLRMEMNHHQRHELRSAFGSKQQQQSHVSDPAGIKKRKKVGKKEGEKGDRMDTS